MQFGKDIGQKVPENHPFSIIFHYRNSILVNSVNSAHYTFYINHLWTQ